MNAGDKEFFGMADVRARASFECIVSCSETAKSEAEKYQTAYDVHVFGWMVAKALASVYEN